MWYDGVVRESPPRTGHTRYRRITQKGENATGTRAFACRKGHLYHRPPLHKTRSRPHRFHLRFAWCFCPLCHSERRRRIPLRLRLVLLGRRPKSSTTLRMTPAVSAPAVEIRAKRRIEWHVVPFGISRGKSATRYARSESHERAKSKPALPLRTLPEGSYERLLLNDQHHIHSTQMQRRKEKWKRK